MSKYVLEEHNGEGRIVGIPVSQKSELGLLIGDTKEQLECGLPMNGKVYRCSDIKEMEAKIEELQQELNSRPQWISVEDGEPEQGKHYWHTHVKTDGTYTPVYRGVYLKSIKAMDVGKVTMNFTHYAESNAPLPPTQED